jgi:hypothetical protein
MLIYVKKLIPANFLYTGEGGEHKGKNLEIGDINTKRLFVLSIFLVAYTLLAYAAVGAEHLDQQKADDVREISKENNEETPPEPETIVPESGIEYQIERQLKGTGLIFSPGSPGGARPSETDNYYKKYPDIEPVIIILPEEKESTEQKEKGKEKNDNK